MKKYLKNWEHFLLLEKQLDLFTGTRWEKPELKYGLNTKRENTPFWPMSTEQIHDLLFELEENGYFVEIQLGFVDEEDGKPSPKELNYGTTKRELTPAMVVSIEPKKVYGTERNTLSSEDLTYVVTSFINRVRQKFKKIEIYEDDSQGGQSIVNLKNIRIQGGLELELAPDDIVNIPKLGINLIWYKPVYLTDKMIIQYHNLDDKTDISYDEKDRAYITYPAEKYCYWLISSRDDYYDFITKNNGFESLWENYWDYVEQPSTEELFNYYLNLDTIKLMVDYLVDDLEQIKDVDEDEYETLTGFEITSKEELIDRIQKVGIKNIGKLLDTIDSDFIDEFKSMYSDMTVSATVDMVQDKIVSALSEVIEEQLQTKVTKTVWKDGHPQITMQFNIDWLEQYEGQDEFLGYVIQEYISNNYLDDNRLRIHVDYMKDPDRNEFNKEVKSSIIGMMNRSDKNFLIDSRKL